MTCAKARVLCTIIANTGIRYTAENACDNPQKTCPRLPGEGYEKCTTICHQRGHAELQALELAGTAATGARVELRGHSYYCKACQDALFAAGVISLTRPDLQA